MYAQTNDATHLRKAVSFLDRYFYLFAFCAYLHDPSAHIMPAFKSEPEKNNDLMITGLDIKRLDNLDVRSSRVPFWKWMKVRPEIWNMLERLRKSDNSVFLFRPVENLQGYLKSSMFGKSTDELESEVVKVALIYLYSLIIIRIVTELY